MCICKIERGRCSASAIASSTRRLGQSHFTLFLNTMSGFFGFISRVYRALRPQDVPKESDALRIGVIGASRIAPMALIQPARDHPGVVIAAIAARETEKVAQAQFEIRRRKLAEAGSGPTTPREADEEGRW